MILTETRSLEGVRNRIDDRIADRYSSPFSIDGQRCYLYGDNHYFMITPFHFEYDSIIVEHAHSLEEAKKDLFEDGDRLYLDEMTDDEIFDAIVREIEG